MGEYIYLQRIDIVWRSFVLHSTTAFGIDRSIRRADWSVCVCVDGETEENNKKDSRGTRRNNMEGRGGDHIKREAEASICSQTLAEREFRVLCHSL